MGDRQEAKQDRVIEAGELETAAAAGRRGAESPARGALDEAHSGGHLQLPEDGSRVHFHEHGWAARDPESGSITIESKLGAPVERRGYEAQLPPAAQIGLHGWERAHPQGAGTGVESPYAILYAPHVVNAFQNHGIESDVRALVHQKRTDVDLYLRTTVRAEGNSSRLRGIEYEVWGVRRDGCRGKLYEHSLELSGEPEALRVEVPDGPVYGPDHDRFLKPPDQVARERKAR